MQDHATDELDVVGNHVPGEFAAGDHDGGAHEAAAGLAHRRKRLGKQLVEHGGDGLPVLGVEPGRLLLQLVAFHRVGALASLGPYFGQLGGLGTCALGDDGPELHSLGLELLFAQRAESLLVRGDLGDQRPEALGVPVMPRAHHLRHQLLDHAIPSW